MIITLDGIDFTGKSTLAEKICNTYRGIIIAPKATSMGLIPNKLEERLDWYRNSPSEAILKAVFESDTSRRKNYNKDAENMIVDRGEITVISDCIAKTCLKENCSYEEAQQIVEEVVHSLGYHPHEDLRIYLKASEQDLPELEKRKIYREGKPFSEFEQIYYPILIRAIKDKSKELQNLRINALQPIDLTMECIAANLKWNQ